MQQSKDMRVVSVIDTIDNYSLTVPIDKRLGIEALEVVIMNFDNDGIKEYDEMVSALYEIGSYSYALKSFDLDLNNRVTRYLNYLLRINQSWN